MTDSITTGFLDQPLAKPVGQLKMNILQPARPPESALPTSEALNETLRGKGPAYFFIGLVSFLTYRQTYTSKSNLFKKIQTNPTFH